MQTDTLYLVPRFTYERRKKMEAEIMERWQRGLEKRHKRGDFSQETPPVEPLKVEFPHPQQHAPPTATCTLR